VIFLKRISGGDGVVAAVVEPVIVPPRGLRAGLQVEVAGEIVVVGPEVDSPANAVGIEDEGAEIEVGVVDVVVAGLESDKEGAGIVPRAAEKRELRGAAEARVEWRRGAGARGVGPGVPHRMQPEKAVALPVSLLAFDRGREEGVTLDQGLGEMEARGEPRERRRGPEAGPAIGIVEGEAGRALDLQAVDGGAVESLGLA
jgi:hypothetical protein